MVIWVLLGLAVFLVCGFGYILKRSREAEAQERRADWSRVRQWDDDNDDDWGQPPGASGKDQD